MAALLHVPCPSCGVTRALARLGSGHLGASLRMHPIAVPALLALTALAASTVWAAWLTGSPATVTRTALGRIAVISGVVVYAAMVGLWVARALGAWGGPVPV
jgi:hypothetical protein